MITIKEKAKVLSSDSTPYDFKGNEGVSHRVRLMVDGEIYAIKSSDKQVEAVKQFVGKDVTVVLNVTSPKELLKMVLVSVEE